MLSQIQLFLILEMHWLPLWGHRRRPPPVAALAVGSVVGAVILSLLKKNRTEAE